jgi:hypothetical protein
VDQGFFCGIRGVEGVPQNCEVAVKSPPLAAGQTDARNGPACIGFIDRGIRQHLRCRDACGFFRQNVAM